MNLAFDNANEMIRSAQGQIRKIIVLSPLSDFTDLEIFQEYNRRKEAMKGLEFVNNAMQDAKDDDLFGDEEEGNHGRPF